MDWEPRTTPYVSAFSVAGAQFALDGLAWAVVRGPAVGVTVPNRYSLAEGRQIAPNPRAPRLGPRGF